MSTKLGVSIPASYQAKSMDLFFEEMEQAGITTGVIVGRNSPGVNLETPPVPAVNVSNDHIAELQQQYPGKLVGLAGIDAGNEGYDALGEIERSVKELKLKGICIEPGRHRVYLNDPSLFPIYQKCVDLGVPIVPHTGGLGGVGPNITFANPAYVDDVATEFPELTIICGHGCYPYVIEACCVAFRHSNVFISPDLPMLLPGVEDYVKATNGFMQDQFIFGSGYPAAPMKDMVEAHDNAGFTENVLEKVFYKNAARALKL